MHQKWYPKISKSDIRKPTTPNNVLVARSPSKYQQKLPAQTPTYCKEKALENNTGKDKMHGEIKKIDDRLTVLCIAYHNIAVE